MPYVDYSLVPNAIRGLTKDIQGASADERAHQERMAGLDLQNAQLGLRKSQIQNEQEISLARQQRENFLNEPVTLEKAIQDHPKMSPQQKAYSLQFISQQLPKESVDYMLRGVTMPRKSWLEKANEAVMQTQKAMEEKAYRDKTLALKERELAIRSRTQDKDRRSNMQKEVEFISQTLNLPTDEAYEKYQNDKSLPERIRLYNNEFDNLSKDLDFQDLKPEEKTRQIQQLRKTYGIDKVTGETMSNDKQQLSLPNNIKKASEAMSYLKEQGLTDEQATSWLRDYMSK